MTSSNYSESHEPESEFQSPFLDETFFTDEAAARASQAWESRHSIFNKVESPFLDESELWQVPVVELEVEDDHYEDSDEMEFGSEVEEQSITDFETDDNKEEIVDFEDLDATLQVFEQPSSATSCEPGKFKSGVLRTVRWKNRTTPGKRYVPKNLKFAIISRGRIKLPFKNIGWLLDEGRGKVEWVEQLPNNINQLFPEVDVTIELWMAIRGKATPANVSKTFSGWLNLRLNELTNCGYLLAQRYLASKKALAESRLELKKFGLDLDSLYEVAHVPESGVPSREDSKLVETFLLQIYITFPKSLKSALKPPKKNNKNDDKKRSLRDIQRNRERARPKFNIWAPKAIKELQSRSITEPHKRTICLLQKLQTKSVDDRYILRDWARSYHLGKLDGPPEKHTTRATNDALDATRWAKDFDDFIDLMLTRDNAIFQGLAEVNRGYQISDPGPSPQRRLRDWVASQQENSNSIYHCYTEEDSTGYENELESEVVWERPREFHDRQVKENLDNQALLESLVAEELGYTEQDEGRVEGIEQHSYESNLESLLIEKLGYEGKEGIEQNSYESNIFNTETLEEIISELALNLPKEVEPDFLDELNEGEIDESAWRMRPPVRYQANRYICWAEAISSWSMVTRGVQKFKSGQDVIDFFKPLGVVNANDSLKLPKGMEEIQSVFGLKFKKLEHGDNFSAINWVLMLRHSHLIVIFRKPGATYFHFVVVYGVDRFRICFMDPELDPGSPSLDRVKRNRVCARLENFGAGADKFWVFWKA